MLFKCFVVSLCLGFTTLTYALTLKSSAFQEGGVIPESYTCKGDNLSPPLSWENPPDKTQAYVLIINDPDAPAGNWDHWIVFNIPGNIKELPQEVDITKAGYKLAKNSWGQATYGGPCPPSGTHHYYFTLYALSSFLPLEERASKKDVEKAMEGKVLDRTTLMGTVSH